ncbi:MAG TPA: response regulator [Bacteroidota bacterium]|nr:response regulator [Bacteroidota bacterium]
MNVLVVDDDNVSTLLLTEQLQSLHYEVSVASDGKEGWNLYLAKQPRIVITDWIMPHVDGLELSRMIRAERRDRYTYIIFLTILRGKGSFLEAMNAGADDVISKPFDADQLAARLRVAERIIGMQHEIRQLEEIIPVCTYCRRIREEDDTWVSIETHIKQKTDTSFSHTICPDCYEQHVQKAVADLQHKGKGQGN